MERWGELWGLVGSRSFVPRWFREFWGEVDAQKWYFGCCCTGWRASRLADVVSAYLFGRRAGLD
jgi:hypothetical protein